jgi:poly-gamma-glutamate synthesis protein (capsule biosynthesis protein)|tara:strand:- start:754 stop:1722 length:969 start_codon:yes stop_codon:yes gene_type:complete
MRTLREYIGKMSSSSNIRLAVSGDVMFGRYVGYDYHPAEPNEPFQEVRRIFENADLSIVNLETVLMDSSPQWWEYHDLPSPDFLRQLVAPTSYASTLSSAGIDLVSLANNHADDGGLVGYASTQSALVDAGLGFAGCSLTGDPFEPTVVMQQGKMIIFFSVTFKRNLGVEFGSVDDYESPLAWISDDAIAESFLGRVQAARVEHPEALILVSVHWGEQYIKEVQSWRGEYAKRLVDAGCNCVLGSHPHILQQVETYNGAIIFYSLGNLFFDHYYQVDGHHRPDEPRTAVGSIFVLDISTVDNNILDVQQILTLSTPMGVLVV